MFLAHKLSDLKERTIAKLFFYCFPITFCISGKLTLPAGNVSYLFLSALRNEVSISSTFYTHLFASIFWRQKLQSCVLGLKFFGAKISAKKARVKC